MFWKKKKPASERELTLVNTLITAMKNDPDGWKVDANYGNPILVYKESPAVTYYEPRSVFNYKLSRCSNSELTYNGAIIELFPENIKRLDEIGLELVREKMIRSLANIAEKKNDNSAN